MSVTAQAQCKSVAEIAGDFEAWGAVLWCESNVQKRTHRTDQRILEQGYQ